jgi:ssRNA-specific RNase YbeY (16S rRNA maturation enzyme)
MDFECFVFEEILVSEKHRKIIDDLINRIFRSKTFVKIIKNQKIQEISFSLVLVGNSDGKKLNYYHRNKNIIPDILSFPF